MERFVNRVGLRSRFNRFIGFPTTPPSRALPHSGVDLPEERFAAGTGLKERLIALLHALTPGGISLRQCPPSQRFEAW
jgi:hypothetical protein